MGEPGFKTKAQELIKLIVDMIADKEYAKLTSSIPPNPDVKMNSYVQAAVKHSLGIHAAQAATNIYNSCFHTCFVLQI